MYKFILFTLLSSALCWAATTALNIKLNSGGEPEKKAKVLIEEFERKYDLKPYIFTHEILIKSMEIPHSHPVLTLNTRQIDEPKRYLGLFLHEQIHWFFAKMGNELKTQNFISKMKAKYPKVPSRKDGGANDDKSTYLHFGVCYYELIVMTKLLGEKDAVRIFSTEDVYFWVRKQVLENREFVAKTLTESGLAWVDENSSAHPSDLNEHSVNQKAQSKKANKIYCPVDYPRRGDTNSIFSIIYKTEQKSQAEAHAERINLNP